MIEGRLHRQSHNMPLTQNLTVFYSSVDAISDDQDPNFIKGFNSRLDIPIAQQVFIPTHMTDIKCTIFSFVFTCTMFKIRRHFARAQWVCR